MRSDHLTNSLTPSNSSRVANASHCTCNFVLDENFYCPSLDINHLFQLSNTSGHQKGYSRSTFEGNGDLNQTLHLPASKNLKSSLLAPVSLDHQGDIHQIPRRLVSVRDPLSQLQLWLNVASHVWTLSSSSLTMIIGHTIEALSPISSSKLKYLLAVPAFLENTNRNMLFATITLTTFKSLFNQEKISSLHFKRFSSHCTHTLLVSKNIVN